MQSHSYSDVIVVVVDDESSINKSKTSLSIDLHVQLSNEEYIFNMNDTIPFEDGFVYEVEDVTGRNEIDNRDKLISMNMRYDSLYLKLSKIVFL